MQAQSLDQEGPWRRKWQPTPLFLPGESQGQRSLEGYSLWGHTESDMTEATQHTHTFRNPTPSLFQTMLRKLHMHLLKLPSLSRESQFKIFPPSHSFLLIFSHYFILLKYFLSSFFFLNYSLLYHTISPQLTDLLFSANLTPTHSAKII